LQASRCIVAWKKNFMNLLLTGATGYAGQGLAGALSGEHWVRGADIVDKPSACHELAPGDITDYTACQKLVDGMDALVLCHMAPNPRGYETPPMAFDINVKGTANLYHAAAEAGIRRVVLISSVAVIATGEGERDARIGVGPYSSGKGLYSLTKVLQEQIAASYYHSHQIATAALRPGWIVNDGELVTKYGEKMERYNPTLVDPRDIGHATLAALALPDLALESFNLGQEGVAVDTASSRERLKWGPHHRFESLPRD
jgi:nucleoside-diphosphate-sugar epimerase